MYRRIGDSHLHKDLCFFRAIFASAIVLSRTAELGHGPLLWWPSDLGEVGCHNFRDCLDIWIDGILSNLNVYRGAATRLDNINEARNRLHGFPDPAFRLWGWPTTKILSQIPRQVPKSRTHLVVVHQFGFYSSNGQWALAINSSFVGPRNAYLWRRSSRK